MQIKPLLSFTTTLLLPVALAAPACTTDPSTTDDDEGVAEEALHGWGHDDTTAVFTLGNASGPNSVLAFRRAGDGTLTPAGETLTGGVGSGAGLGSQGALVLAKGGRYLLAVNPGSNDISSFAVRGSKLELRSRVSSGGLAPISIAESWGLVYVLNGGSNDVSGLYLDDDGRLHTLAGTTKPLSGTNVGGAQVAFSPDGGSLVVTEKATNMIDTFAVRYDGSLRSAISVTSAGTTPFGFGFTSRGQLIVSEAAGGAAGAGTVSSYALDRTSPYSWNRRARLIDGPVGDLQAAPCWIAITNDNRYAYTSNTASGTISGYAVSKSGSLELFPDGGATAVTGDGSKPTDIALDRRSRRLFVLDSGTHELEVFAVGADGGLTSAGTSVSTSRDGGRSRRALSAPTSRPGPSI